MSPFEVASKYDMVRTGREYPGLRLRGGIDKRILAAGPDAIDRELVHCKLSLFALLRSFKRARDLANSFDTSSIGGFAKSQSRSKSLSHIRTFKIYNAPERIIPAMMARGGYIPTCDHGVPEEVSLENYFHYRRRMREYSR